MAHPDAGPFRYSPELGTDPRILTIIDPEPYMIADPGRVFAKIKFSRFPLFLEMVSWIYISTHHMLRISHGVELVMLDIVS